MNLFQIYFLNFVVLIFPIFIYLIYLVSNKNINNKSKNLYLKLSLLSSFYLLYKFGVYNKTIFFLLILYSIIILSYVVDDLFIGNIFSILILILYNNIFNKMILWIILYIFIILIYILKNKIKLSSFIFIQIILIISSIFYFIWIYYFNIENYNFKYYIISIIGYFLITNILCLMYEVGKDMLKSHLTYKELQKDKQISLSLFKITHEIKNPIAVCKCYLDMINVKDSKQVQRYVPIIKSEIDRILCLLQDFLYINKNNINFDILDINMLVDDTINKLKNILDEKDIKLINDIVDDEVFIDGDYNRLSQVLINILKNSIEAISDNGLINISSKIKKDKYILSIEDNGNGISREVLNKMNEPFYTTKSNGTGLGVPLIYEIIEAHKGNVKYISNVGCGTKVILTLPLYSDGQ